MRRLGVTSRTLRRYTAEGKLPDVRGAGNRRIFRVSDLDKLTSQRSAKAGRLRAAVAAEARSDDAA